MRKILTLAGPMSPEAAAARARTTAIAAEPVTEPEPIAKPVRRRPQPDGGALRHRCRKRGKKRRRR